MSKTIPAEVYPLGDFIRDELAERGWTVDDLCRGTAMDEHRVKALLADNATRLSMREAEWLGCALGVSAGMLLTLQKMWFDRQQP